MYSLSTKIEYATDITLGRIKQLSSATQKGAKLLLTRVLITRAD
jgi:hypothetical protein